MHRQRGRTVGYPVFCSFDPWTEEDQSSQMITLEQLTERDSTGHSVHSPLHCTTYTLVHTYTELLRVYGTDWHYQQTVQCVDRSMLGDVSHLIGVPTMSLSWKLSGWFHSFKLLRQRLHYSVDVINSDHHWRGCQTHRQLVVVLVTHTVRQTDRQTDMRIVKRIVSQWENIEWSHQCDNEWHTWRQL